MSLLHSFLCNISFFLPVWLFLKFHFYNWILSNLILIWVFIIFVLLVLWVGCGFLDLWIYSFQESWHIFGYYIFKYLFPFSLLSLRDCNCLWIRPHQAVSKLTEGLFTSSILSYLCVSFWIVSLPSNVSLLIFSSVISNLLYFLSVL